MSVIKVRKNPIVAHLVGAGRVPAAALAPDAFPGLLEAHRRAYPHTARVEALGRALVKADFRNPKRDQFIREVCRWGGYAGVAGRVLKRNRAKRRRTQIQSAWEALKSEDVAAALGEITALNGLGGVSFASKHLRMLAPDRCVVYDRFLAEVLAPEYRFAGTGVARKRSVQDAYARLCRDFRALAEALEACGVRRPGGGRWRAADVEAAVFMAVRERAGVVVRVRAQCALRAPCGRGRCGVR